MLTEIKQKKYFFYLLYFFHSNRFFGRLDQQLMISILFINLAISTRVVLLK